MRGTLRTARWRRGAFRRDRSAGTAEPGTRTVTVHDVAAVLDLLALALSGGQGVDASLRHVAAVAPRHLAGDLQRVVAGLAWGLTSDEAWAACGPAWAPARRALALAAEAGLPPSPLLRQAASDLREREQARLEEADGTLGARLVIPLGLLFLPAFMCTTVIPVVVALARNVLAP